MNRKILALAGALVGISVGFGLAAHPAHANQAPAFTKTVTACTPATKTFQNSDEQTRKPVQTPGGLKFAPSDLIHIAYVIPVADLHPGSFHAFPAPDQPSFFSVELADPDGAYGTLRWNTTTHKWDITTSGPAAGQFSFTHPADVVGVVTKWGAFTAATKVITFGVGYTVSPPGTVVTTVSSIHFGGHTYDLRCKPVVTAVPTPTKTSESASPSASASSSISASPSASHSASGTATPPTGGPTNPNDPGTGALAVTGAPTGLIAILGVGLLLAGGAALLVLRRKTRFTA